MQTATEVKAHGKDMELAEVNFLGPDGKLARKRRHIRSAEFKFIDGKTFRIPKHELRKLDNFEFKLRPKRNDA